MLARRELTPALVIFPIVSPFECGVLHHPAVRAPHHTSPAPLHRLDKTHSSLRIKHPLRHPGPARASSRARNIPSNELRRLRQLGA